MTVKPLCNLEHTIAEQVYKCERDVGHKGPHRVEGADGFEAVWSAKFPAHILNNQNEYPHWCFTTRYV